MYIELSSVKQNKLTAVCGSNKPFHSYKYCKKYYRILIWFITIKSMLILTLLINDNTIMKHGRRILSFCNFWFDVILSLMLKCQRSLTGIKV